MNKDFICIQSDLAFSDKSCCWVEFLTIHISFSGLQLFSKSFKWQLCVFSRNIEVMKQRLKDLWKEGAHICLVPGSTGELAKV